MMAEEKSGFAGFWIGAGVFAVAAAGVLALRLQRDEVAVPMADPAAITAPVVAENAAMVEKPTEAAPVVDPTPAAPEPAPMPSFDTVRVEPDGSALVAGQGPAGATLQVMVDGVPVATETVNENGSFAALFDLPGSDLPRLMTLQAVLPDGTALASADSVALAPIAGAMEVAEAEPAPAEPQRAEPPQAEPEPAEPAALLLTESGASVLQQPAAAEDAGGAMPVSIDVISYAPDGAVQLSGQAAPGAFVRLYLDNSELATFTAPEAGPWSLTLPDVAPGLYTLRADVLGADGKVVSRFETPFKRETVAALVASSEAPAAPEAKPVVNDAAVPVAEEPSPVTLADQPVAVTAAAEDQVASAGTAPITMTVQPGYSLWKIARDSYGDGVMYVQVFEANRDKIRNPDLIYPGQVFTMPEMP